MKIAYLTPTGALGGAELCLLDLLASIRASRPDWRPTVLIGGEGPLVGEVERLGIACEVLTMPSSVAGLGDAGLADLGRFQRFGRLAIGGAKAFSSLLDYRKRLAAWLLDTNPDVVQSNGMKMHVLAAWSARRGLPVVWHLHDYLGSRSAMKVLLKASRRPGLTAVGVSDSVTTDAEGVLGPRVPVRTIHNRIDVDRFDAGSGDRADLDRLAGLEPAETGTIRVGLVATFAIWKGHRHFLEAVARIPKDLKTRFYLVGGPIYQSAGSQVTLEGLREIASTLGIADRVAFTGHLSDPASAIKALDVVVHASTRPEPFGRVIVEGMAAGKAVVTSGLGGALELIEAERTAIAVPPGDPEALASAIDRLIREPETRDRLGHAGRISARSRFDRTGLADDWATVYGSERSASPTKVDDRFAIGGRV